MRRLIIIGAGELGQQALHYATLSHQYNVVGFLDDTKNKDDIIKGKPVMGGLSEIHELYSRRLFECVFIAIGYKHFDFKEKLYKELIESSIPLGTIICPNVYIDPTAEIGQGCFIYPGTIIDKEVSIADNVLCNLNSVISHNSIINLHTYISPSVSIAGFCEVGEKCMIGINATIIDNVTICNNVTIGAATLVRKSIKEPGTYVGNLIKKI